MLERESSGETFIMTRISDAVFIVYPSAFSCRSKFERNTKDILDNLKSFSIFFINDCQKHISSCFENDNREVAINQISNFDPVSTQITHAIFFDDGVSCHELINQCESEKIKTKIIEVKIATVINIGKGGHYDVYVGRGSGFGNPYAIGFDGDLEDVIRKFKYDFDRDYLREGAAVKEKLKKLRGKRLGCHCKPAPCHGDILVEYINSLDD